MQLFGFPEMMLALIMCLLCLVQPVEAMGGVSVQRTTFFFAHGMCVLCLVSSCPPATNIPTPQITLACPALSVAVVLSPFFFSSFLFIPFDVAGRCCCADHWPDHRLHCYLRLHRKVCTWPGLKLKLKEVFRCCPAVSLSRPGVLVCGLCSGGRREANLAYILYSRRQKAEGRRQKQANESIIVFGANFPCEGSCL